MWSLTCAKSLFSGSAFREPKLSQSLLLHNAGGVPPPSPPSHTCPSTPTSWRIFPNPASALSTLTPPQCRSLGCSGSLPTSVWESLAPDHLCLPPSHFSGLSSNAFCLVGSSATTVPKEPLPNYSPSNDFYEPTGRNAFCLRSQYTHTHTHTHPKAKDSQNPSPYCT